MIRSFFSLFALVASLILFLLYTRPMYDGLAEVQTVIARYDQALSRTAELQKIRKDLETKYEAITSSDKDRLLKLLPDHVDNVRLVLDLDSMAIRHQMAIQNVVVNTTGDKDKSPTIGGATSPLKYDSITLRFSTDGTYQNFVAFLTELERSLRIVDIVSLSVGQGTPVLGSETVYHYDITVRTYWLR